MSISDRVTHVSSITLILVLALATAGWTSLERTTHCLRQTRSCTSRALLTCCGPTAPTPIDRIQLPRQAPPTTYVSTASLMDTISVTSCEPSCPTLMAGLNVTQAAADLPIRATS